MVWEMALLAATVAVAFGTAVLMGIMYLLERKSFLALWGISWIVFIACIGTIIIQNKSLFSDYGIEVFFYLIFSLFQYIGTRAYVGHSLKYNTVIILLVSALFASILLYVSGERSLYAIGMNIFSAAIFWMTAWTIFRAPAMHHIERYIIFVIYILAGFHELSQSLYMNDMRDIYVWYGMHLLLILLLTMTIFWNYLKTEKKEKSELIDRYEKTFYNNHAVMLMVDPSDSSIIDCNEAAAAFYGYEPSVLKTMKMRQINVAGAVEIQHALDKATKTEHETFYFQHRISDGSIKDVEVLSGPLKTKGKTVLLSIIRDITESVRNAKLHATERELLMLINQASDEHAFLQQFLSILHTMDDINLTCLYLYKNANHDEIERICSYNTSTEMLAIIDNRALIEAAFFHVQNGNAVRLDDISKSSAPFVLLSQIQVMSLMIEPVMNGNVVVGVLLVGSSWKNAILGMRESFLISLAYQIGSTLRRLDADASKALSESRWRFALEGIGDLVLEIDTRQGVSYPGGNTEKVLGYSLNDMPVDVDGWLRLIHNDDVQIVKKAIMDNSQGKQTVYAIEHRVRTKWGDRWFLNRGCNIYQTNGGEATIMAVLTDIHPAKEFAVELIAAKEQLEQANNIKNLFLANMSHELRTPMNGIFGMLQLLEISDLDMDQRESISIMRDSSKRMMGLINNLITYTTIEGGAVSLNEEIFDIGETIREIVESYRPEIIAKELKLYFECSQNLPTELYGDAEKIGMIVHQWMENAIKFTDAGSITVTVKPDVPISGVQDSISVLVSISDTGIGISADDLPNLFMNFTQADSSYTRTHQGAGLGLAICRQVRDILGATFEVDSAPGEGAIFKMRIRLKTVQNNMLIQQASGYSGNVLVVDDDEVSRRLLGLFCEKADMSVHYAANGREAILKNAAQTFDLILMDIQMPDMSGVEATKIIHMQNTERSVSPTIIAVTAYALKGDQERFLQEGMDDFLSKPIDSGQLYTMIKKWMTVRRSLH